MTKFDCNWCAKCCDSFGEFIKIERQVDDRNYFCRYGITDEIFPVHVHPEWADEIDEEFMNSSANDPNSAGKKCIFSRKKQGHPGYACAIYETRPTICRDFKCYRMLIHHRMTCELRGRVMGINELRTHDEILDAVWREKIAHLPHPIHAMHPGGDKVHGHDSHLRLHLLDIEHGDHGDDHEWLSSVMEVLSAHGYNGDPIEE